MWLGSKNTWLVGTLFITWHPSFLALHVGKRSSLHLDKGTLALVNIWEHHLVVNSGIITNTVFSVHFLTNEGIHPGTYSSAGNKPQRRLSPRLNSGGITEYRSCITKFRSSVNLKYIVKKLSLWLDLVGELDSFILASLRNWAPWKPQSWWQGWRNLTTTGFFRFKYTQLGF